MKINVIGAGIIGSAVAARLAVEGASVTLCDPNPPGGLASAASFGWINASYGNPKPYFDLRRAAMEEWHALKAADPDLPFRPDGTLILHYDTDHETHFKDHTAWGYALDWMDKSAIRHAEPNLATDVETALFAPEEGQLDVSGAAQHFAAQCVQAGGEITHAASDRLDLEAADMTVLAAGTASAELARSVGVDLPMTAPPGLLVYSKPLPERVLFHTVLTDGLHLQQRHDGRLVGGADFGGGVINDDPAGGAEEIFGRMRRALPGIDLAYDSLTLGRRPTPLDGMPVVGSPASLPGLYITVMHSGATLAPIIAKLSADEILRGRRDPLLAPFGPDRFS